MKKKTTLFLLICCLFVTIVSLTTKQKKTKYTHFNGKPYFSSQSPAGYTGENGFNCSACHGSFAVNSGGGNLVVSGLPTVSYGPGQTYPITVTINHGTADRTRWGFALAVRNSSGNAAGSFTSTNPNVVEISPGEVGHQGAVVTSASASYTYVNVNWVAPVSPTPEDLNLNFYVVGNASNNNSGSDGDYIYTQTFSRSFNIVPVILTRFNGSVGRNATVVLQWETSQEVNSDVFVIERSIDGQNFVAVDRVRAKGNSTTPASYQYTDNLPAFTRNAPSLYRLKQVDKDGRFSYSQTVSIKLNLTNTFMDAPFPNILTKGMSSSVRFFAEKPMQLQLTLTDATGKKLYVNQMQITAGFSMIPIPSTAFANKLGTFYLTVQSGSFKQTERLLVQ